MLGGVLSRLRIKAVCLMITFMQKMEYKLSQYLKDTISIH